VNGVLAAHRASAPWADAVQVQAAANCDGDNWTTVFANAVDETAGKIDGLLQFPVANVSEHRANVSQIDVLMAVGKFCVLHEQVTENGHESAEVATASENVFYRRMEAAAASENVFHQ
jgi:hypothetical protein